MIKMKARNQSSSIWCNRNTLITKYAGSFQQGSTPALHGAFCLAIIVFLFTGIAQISDIFMQSIQVITDKKRKVQVYDSKAKCYTTTEVKCWNATVANLSLLAFGSSSPEILLATIEIIRNK